MKKDTLLSEIRTRGAKKGVCNRNPRKSGPEGNLAIYKVHVMLHTAWHATLITCVLPFDIYWTSYVILTRTLPLLQ